MKQAFVRTALVALTFTLSSFAQTPAAPAAAAPAPATTKLAIVNIQAAVANTNEGKRELEGLDKKFEPKIKELQALQTDIENLNKQLSTQGDKLNAETKAGLERQIGDKTKQFQRGREDYQNEAQGAEQEVFQKMAPKIMKSLDTYAKTNGFTLVLDWGVLQNGVLWATQGVDITQAVIDAYNSDSGAAAPAKPAATTPKPAATKAAPAATKPVPAKPVTK